MADGRAAITASYNIVVVVIVIGRTGGIGRLDEVGRKWSAKSFGGEFVSFSFDRGRPVGQSSRHHDPLGTTNSFVLLVALSFATTAAPCLRRFRHRVHGMFLTTGPHQ
jgi:membrane-associated PAP2 superfamily phosphatase